MFLSLKVSFSEDTFSSIAILLYCQTRIHHIIYCYISRQEFPFSSFLNNDPAKHVTSDLISTQSAKFTKTFRKSSLSCNPVKIDILISSEPTVFQDGSSKSLKGHVIITSNKILQYESCCCLSVVLNCRTVCWTSMLAEQMRFSVP